MGNFFRKALRILELDERKDKQVVEQDFHGIPLSPVSLTELSSFWYGLKLRFLHPTQVNRQSCPCLLKLMMSQAVEGVWICLEVMGRSGVHGF